MAKGQNYEEQIKSQIRDLNRLKEERRRKCEHKGNHDLCSIENAKFNIPNKKDLPEGTVACNRCEKYFYGDAYTPADGDAGLYMFNSMVEQVKINANLTDEDRITIDNVYTSLDNLANFVSYYNSMVEKMSNGGGKQQNKPKHSAKGHIGISPNMFSRGF